VAPLLYFAAAQWQSQRWRSGSASRSRVPRLSIAGITDGADVYIGSWSDWITSPDRPIALG